MIPSHSYFDTHLDFRLARITYTFAENGCVCVSSTACDYAKIGLPRFLSEGVPIQPSLWSAAVVENGGNSLLIDEFVLAENDPQLKSLHFTRGQLRTAPAHLRQPQPAKMRQATDEV